MKASEKQLSFGVLSDFTSFDGVLEWMIEREVEGVIRESHSKQFAWMESRFSVPLREGLASWPQFVELTERRNLFVHCDGVTSSQYISNCKTHGVVLPEGIRRSSRLRVDKAYFEQSFACLLQLGVKLGQVLWRKLFPDEVGIADESLNDVCYQLIADRRYKLAQVLLEFAVNTLKKHKDKRYEQTFIVNLAQAHKWDGDEEVCERILSSHDWSVSSLDFHLAVAVLSDRFDDAASTMRRMGTNGGVRVTEYREWPLFKEFMKSDVFISTYKEVFGEDFYIEQEIKETDEEKTIKPEESADSKPVRKKKRAAAHRKSRLA